MAPRRIPLLAGCLLSMGAVAGPSSACWTAHHCPPPPPPCLPPHAGPLIRKYLLENTHRVTVELRPDVQLAAEIDAAEQARLEEVQSGLSTEDLQQVGLVGPGFAG